MTRLYTGSALRRGLSMLARPLAAAIALLLLSLSALAHGGHDHGSDTAALEIGSLSRATATSDSYQLVAVLERQSLVITLDRQQTNTPVVDADITVTIDTTERKVARRPDGTYVVEAPEVAKAGRHELIVAIRDGTASDLLITALDVPEAPKTQAKPRIVADTPSRLSDGSVFLPKVSQRLLGLRTVTAAEATLAPAVTLVGRIIADPNRSGVVQSSIAGRVNAVDGGLPHLGQPVTAGQVLGIVTPAFAPIDMTNVQQTGAELDQLIALAQNKVDQFRPLVRSQTLSQERLRTVEIELESLKKRRATLAVSQRGSEPLTAPVDGVIAGLRAVPGQVVSPSDVLFHIVDPKSLWVEALIFDPSVPDLVGEATATVAGAPPLTLKPVGRSRALQQLSTVMHFAVVDPPASLNIGSPVTVLARQSARVSGLVVPRSALVAAASGESLVWVHGEPERFQPRAVKIRPIDGETVLIEAGLQAGERIVTSAAELINQVR